MRSEKGEVFTGKIFQAAGGPGSKFTGDHLILCDCAFKFLNVGKMYGICHNYLCQY
jgi:hypothetical protein